MKTTGRYYLLPRVRFLYSLLIHYNEKRAGWYVYLPTPAHFLTTSDMRLRDEFYLQPSQLST
jgi:hypothetical protein